MKNIERKKQRISFEANSGKGHIRENWCEISSPIALADAKKASKLSS
jgi:hypothetical protein